MNYRQQLLHPNWQRKRLEVFQHCGWKCERCGDAESTLHVHHHEYRRGALAWEYELDEFACLCVHCHTLEHRIGNPPPGTRAHKRSLWEKLGSYHIAACVHAADGAIESSEMHEFARRLCAADGHDYDAMVKEMSA